MSEQATEKDKLVQALDSLDKESLANIRDTYNKEVAEMDELLKGTYRVEQEIITTMCRYPDLKKLFVDNTKAEKAVKKLLISELADVVYVHKHFDKQSDEESYQVKRGDYKKLLKLIIDNDLDLDSEYDDGINWRYIYNELTKDERKKVEEKMEPVFMGDEKEPLNMSESIVLSVILSENLYPTICFRTKDREKARQLLCTYFKKYAEELAKHKYHHDDYYDDDEKIEDYKSLYNLLKETIKGHSFNRVYSIVESHYLHVSREIKF